MDNASLQPGNLSQEAQEWINYELDRDWHARAVRYGPEDDLYLDDELYPGDEPPTAEETARSLEAARRYRENKIRLCLEAERRQPWPDGLPRPDHLRKEK